ncbi:MAG: flippase activity-associated protein Agl23 [Halolamina sp.]
MRADARRRVPAALLGLTAVALLLRAVGLGGRVFHWDEGRVGYWILRYQETGSFAYRPIIHGPVVQHANALLFEVVPATDFAARLPVAVVGAALPLSAWLFRERLDRFEVVALGGVIALNPLLVYYSRFMRSDVLVGAFAFVAFAFVVRAWDAESIRHLYPGAVSLALAVGSKENALVYLACFLGAAALLYDHRLVRATGRVWTPTQAAATTADASAEEKPDAEPEGEPDSASTDGGTAPATSAWQRLRADVVGLAGVASDLAGETDARLWTVSHLVGVALTFLAVVVVLYAPRPALWEALADPGRLPAVVEAATVGAWEKFYGLWGSSHGNNYLVYLHDLLETLVYGAPVVVALGVVGFVADGYLDSVGGRQRSLVAFAAYWAAASVVGYPVATDIRAPWAAVHVVVPLSIPAAVGAAAVAKEARSAVAAEDAARVALAGSLLLAAVVAPVGLTADYWNAASVEDERVLQWAQPGNDLEETLATVETVARDNEGTDVLFVGTDHPATGETLFYVANESRADRPPPGGPAWHSRLPLQWYLERYDANVTSTPPPQSTEQVATDAPPVVIAYDFDDDAATDDARVHDADDLRPHLDGYEAHRHNFKLWGEHVVVFVDEQALSTARFTAPSTDGDAN